LSTPANEPPTADPLAAAELAADPLASDPPRPAHPGSMPRAATTWSTGASPTVVTPPQPASGDATVYSFTVNHHRFNPSVPVPYVVALVELVEQEGLRLPTNIVGCEPADVRIGMAVHVAFEDHGAVWVPVFRPLGG